MNPFRLQRLGILMQPQIGNALEAEGVLNPAAVRGPDGTLFLFPRLVARGNFSRIGLAHVQFDQAGDPIAAERIGIAIEPEADYEALGCEDPRITFIEPIARYAMSYTALSSSGPRIAVAISENLLSWKRLGLLRFSSFNGIDFDHIPNKDASLFPVSVNSPTGQPGVALLHRPLFPHTRPQDTVRETAPREVDQDRESIWISYCPMQFAGAESHCLGPFTSHHRLAAPVAPWEQLKIGGGAPPIVCRHGWLVVYHGVQEVAPPMAGLRSLCYSAGVMILSREHPPTVLYRASEPILSPLLPDELYGTVPNVVFPTGIDRRDDLGTPDRFDVYYGMADNRIGVATLTVPEFLPA
jgi:beta-1,2-mannobiose phosphorylase / 1,2-beta-oligomannan phosphorylase